jgi:hypothetical protein
MEMKTFVCTFEFEAEDKDFAIQAAFDIVNQYRLNAFQTTMHAHAKTCPTMAADFEKVTDNMNAVMETLIVEEKK